MMTTALITAALVLAADTGEGIASAFALKDAPNHLEDVLKSPATAKYAVKSAERLGPSNTLVDPRYTVRGSVDSANGFGALVRSPWMAVVHIDGTTPKLLGLTIGEDDDVKGVYLAPADQRFKPALIKRVRDDLQARRDRLRAQAAKVPVKKRKVFVQRETQRLLAEAKKYGLTPQQVAEILKVEE
jgi:hypothetical protein